MNSPDLKNIPLSDLIKEIESRIEDPSINLPYELFLFGYRNMAITNVDVFVRHKEKGVLLCWRDDEIFGQGWHIPGRVVRHKNSVEKSVKDCFHAELNIPDIDFNRLKFLGVFDYKDETLAERAHGITLTYELELDDLEAEKYPETDEVKWFKGHPQDLLNCHVDMYGHLLKY